MAVDPKMRSRLPLTLAALSVTLLAALPAQEAQPTPAKGIADATKALRSKSKQHQLDALVLLGACSADAATWQELGITRAVAHALASPHKTVVTNAVATLAKSPDRDAAMQLIAARVAKLSKSLRGVREPKWPKTIGLGISIPVLPPFLPFNPTAKQKREHNKRLAAFKRKQAAASKKAAQDKRIRTKAFKDDAKLIAAAKELADLAHHLRHVRSDTVTDALLGAYRTMMKKEAVQVAPIATALIASRRRDAVAACITAVTENKDLDAAQARDRNRFTNQQALDREQRIKDRKAGKKHKSNSTMVANVLAMSRMRKAVREQLQALGKQHGIDIELPKISDADMKILTGRDKEAKAKVSKRMDRESLAAWQAWLQELTPHLVEKVES